MDAALQLVLRAATRWLHASRGLTAGRPRSRTRARDHGAGPAMSCRRWSTSRWISPTSASVPGEGITFDVAFGGEPSSS